MFKTILSFTKMQLSPSPEVPLDEMGYPRIPAFSFASDWSFLTTFLQSKKAQDFQEMDMLLRNFHQWEKKPLIAFRQDFYQYCEEQSIIENENQSYFLFFLSMFASGAWGANYQDDEKHANYAEQSANLVNSYGMKQIGYCYYFGIGGPADLGIAENWYQQAISLDQNPYALVLLGDLLDFQKDTSKVEELYRLARGHKIGPASYALAQWRLTHSPAAKELKALYQEASERGSTAAMVAYGVITEKYSASTFEKCKYWLIKAGMMGDHNAFNYLAYFFREGIKVQKDLHMSWLYYQMAAEEKNPAALYSIGSYYLNGVGIKKDATQAVDYFREAAQLGNSYAMYSLGSCYEKGQGVQLDLDLAVTWYVKSAEADPYQQTDSFSYTKVGTLCFDEKLVERDYQTGFAYLRKALRVNPRDYTALAEINQKKTEIPLWYQHPHPKIALLLLCARHYLPNSYFSVDFLPLDVLKIIWKLSQIGKFPSAEAYQQLQRDYPTFREEMPKFFKVEE